MKKRHFYHHHHRWWNKLGLLLFGFIFCLTLTQMLPNLRFKYMDFDVSRLSSAKPKIAFLFIARNRLPLDFVWQRFFEGTAEPNFSIYIHSRPGFIYSKGTTKCTFCYGRQLTDSIQVDWGEASMIQAERILLRKALQDLANQRFIFLSDSCIPLYNFSYIYDYVMSSSESFVDSFSDTKEGRYNPKMASVIPVDKWRKGSQWVTLTRKHAEVVVADDTVFPIFQQYCKRKPLPEFWRQQEAFTDVSKEHNCIPDEHYVQTLLAMKNLEGEINRRTLSYTLWQSAMGRERQGWHPVTFKYTDANAKLIKDIKSIDHIYYETEHRTEWCSTNGERCPCFLFARKFSRAAMHRLINQVNFDHCIRLSPGHSNFVICKK